MNIFSFAMVLAMVGTVVTGLMACSREDSAEGGARTKGREPLRPVTVEVREDGLAYLPTGEMPFTGEAISAHPDKPWLVKMKEPYTAGKRNGDKKELFKNGTVKVLRRYEAGVPKHAETYHNNGQIKFKVYLNAADKGEGPYRRWYEDGTLEATSGLDAEEKWHGEFKEWTKAGELKTHHIFSHGLLEQIMFETPESKIARKAAGLEVTQSAASPSRAQ